MSDDTRSFEDVSDGLTRDLDGLVDDIMEKAKEYEHSELGTEQGRKYGYAASAGMIKSRLKDCKHTTGTIDGYEFTLRVDGDAPDALVADIEARLAECKAERENDE